MRKKVMLYLLGLIFSVSGMHAQQIKLVALPVVVSEMAAHDIYESERVGFASLRSAQFARYQQLAAIATEEQLLALAADHSSAVVRLYAYQALRERKITIPKNLQEKFKTDETIVQTLDGCIANKFTVSKLAEVPLLAQGPYNQLHFIPAQFTGQ